MNARRRQQQQQQQQHMPRMVVVATKRANDDAHYHSVSGDHRQRLKTNHHHHHHHHFLHASTASGISMDGGSSSSSSSNENVILLSKPSKRQLTREFITIGLPALVQLAAEPLAGLVDTMYLGRLGPDVLGGAGVAVSANYAVSKLYNDPLLRTSISLVASQDGKTRQSQIISNGDDDDDDDNGATERKNKKDLSIAVSSALLLAISVGVIQMLVYTIFCRGITQSMGLTTTSPMWHSAVTYLQIRALGTPAATLWLVTNGIFRGLGDTRTPLLYSLFFTALNAMLDPIFIFMFHWGASGAAAGTALAQYVALIPLLVALNKKVSIDVVGQFGELKSTLRQYLQAGSLVLFRTVGKVLAYSVCARQAAILGSVAAAAYNLTFQLGFATTQICEAVAVAVQTLLAREMAEATTPTAASTETTGSSTSENDKKSVQQPIIMNPILRAKRIRHLIRTSVWCGGSVAMILSLVTFWRRDAILASLTTNVAIQQAAASIFPAVLLTQVLKGLAYPVNGILMGGLDWWYSMATMWFSNIVCIGLVRYFVVTNVGAGIATGTGAVTLMQIWWALAAFMGTQVVAGILRYEGKRGVWKVLQDE
jgi:putative MATE family efflux protein